MKMKFCANLTFMFRDVSKSFIERYSLAKNAGFQYVETGFPFELDIHEVKEAKEKAGVQQVLVNLKTGDTSAGQMGVTCIPGKEKQFSEDLLAAVNAANLLGAKKIHIMAGLVSGEVTEAHWHTYECNLANAIEQLAKYGIVGVIEPINTHTVPNYFMNSYEKAIEIIKRIGNPHLKLMLDIFHLQQIQGDLTYNIKKLMPYVGHIQIAQVPSRNEPDTIGEINYEYILKVIEETGYDGFIGLEYTPAGNTVDGLKWINKFGYKL